VFGAIQHAHEKGIIHRDIRPSNVPVHQDNGAPIAKVIEFGVAKATDQRLTRETMCTEQGVLIGTPESMSPEQADGSVLETREPAGEQQYVDRSESQRRSRGRCVRKLPGPVPLHGATCRAASALRSFQRNPHRFTVDLDLRGGCRFGQL
jgi:serine/threonine protein kinase